MTSAGADPPLVIKGWSIFAHPQFLDTFESLLPPREPHHLRLGQRRKYQTRIRERFRRLSHVQTHAQEIVAMRRPRYMTGASQQREARLACIYHIKPVDISQEVRLAGCERAVEQPYRLVLARLAPSAFGSKYTWMLSCERVRFRME